MGGITKLLRQHRKWLTLIGGMILFLTFLIKEGFRDSAKDQLATFTAAQAEYRANKNHRDEMSAIARGPHIPGTVVGQGPIETKQQVYTVAARYNAGAHREELFDTQDLASSIPTNSDIAAKRKAVTDETEKFDKMYETLEEGDNRETQNDPSAPNEKKQINDLSDQEAAVIDATNNYTYAVLETAKSRHDDLEWRYRSFTIASYFLFTFGLIISILGKLLERSDEPLDVDM